MTDFTTPRFLYFDLGNVLLFFDHEVACRQMADVAGVREELVRDVVFGSDLQLRYERGEITCEEFHDVFCRETKSQPTISALHRAGSDIFKLNVAIVPVVAGIRRAGYRIGILSNTCKAHWDFITPRYKLISSAFDLTVLSFEVGAMKPAPKIYEAAAKRANVLPNEILLVDDRDENVQAAREGGFDAVQFTSTPNLMQDLRDRRLRFNY